MSSTEPVGVAFVEVVPEAAGFKRKLESELAAQRAVVGVAPSPGTAAATKQIQGLAGASGEAATAQELLAEASAKYAIAQEGVVGIESTAARVRLQAARASEADALAKRALLAITEETTAATVAEIDALIAKTAAANTAAAAEERAAFGAHTHAAASREATEAILAETASMTGLRGASIGVNPAFLAATAASIIFFKSAEAGGEFTEQMHLIEAATHATRSEMEEAGKTAHQLGQDLDLPATSALQAAEAIADLTRSGNTLVQSEKEARAVLLLHASANVEIEKSTEIVTRLLKAYNLSAGDSVRVVDTLTSASLAGAGSAEEYASALQTLAPISHSLGLDLQETATLLIQFAQGGVSASQAATLTRLAFARLAAGTKPVRDALDAIGLKLKDLRDAQGNVRPDVFVILGEAVAGLGRQQQQQALSAIFGARAGARLLPILDQSREEYARAAEKAHELGTAQEQAEARARSLGGQSRELGAELGDLGLTIGKVANPFLTNMIGGLREGAHLINQWVSLQGRMLGFLGGIVGVGRQADKTVDDLASHLQDLREQAAFQEKLGLEIDPELKTEIEEVATALDHKLKPAILDGKAAADAYADSLHNAAVKTKELTEASVAAVGPAQQGALALAQAQASGDKAAELTELRAQEARQVAFIARQAKLPQTKARVATETKANQNLAATRAQIKSILDERVGIQKQAAGDAEQAAQDIVKANNEHDQAIIDSISAEEARRSAAVTHAATVGSLRARISAEIAQRNFYNRAIEEVRKTVRVGKTKAAELQQLRLAKRAINDQIAADREEQRTARQEAAAAAVESAQLDLELTQIRAGDADSRTQQSIRREVAAHQRVIAALKRAQRFTKAGTVEYKRLRNEIAQEQQAIRELRHQTEAARNEANFGALSFAFLQEQQGVLSNFGPNFFPGGALSVSSGGGPQLGGSASTVSTARPPLPGPQNPNILSPFEHGRGRGPKGARDAGGVGITTGQGNELIHQVRLLVREMHLLRRGAGHPANRHSENWNRHVMDH